MRSGRKTRMNTRRPKPERSPISRPQRWVSNGPGAEQRSSRNAKSNYDRYLALAQAELQAGDRVAAENYPNIILD